MIFNLIDQRDFIPSLKAFVRVPSIQLWDKEGYIERQIDGKRKRRKRERRLFVKHGRNKEREREKEVLLFFKSRGSFYRARPVDACRRREFREIEALLLN